MNNLRMKYMSRMATSVGESSREQHLGLRESQKGEGFGNQSFQDHDMNKGLEKKPDSQALF
jgi:hypothetical protein